MVGGDGGGSDSSDGDGENLLKLEKMCLTRRQKWEQRPRETSTNHPVRTKMRNLIPSKEENCVSQGLF